MLSFWSNFVHDFSLFIFLYLPTYPSMFLNMGMSVFPFSLGSLYTLVLRQRPLNNHTEPISKMFVSREHFTALYEWFNFDIHWLVACFISIKNCHCDEMCPKWMDEVLKWVSAVIKCSVFRVSDIFSLSYSFPFIYIASPCAAPSTHLQVKWHKQSGAENRRKVLQKEIKSGLKILLQLQQLTKNWFLPTYTLDLLTSKLGPY